MERIAQSIFAADDVPKTLHRWVGLAGPALAAESQYADRVERRRKRRLRSKENRRTAAQAREELALREQHSESKTILELALAIKRSPTRTAEDLDRVLMLLETMDSVRGRGTG